MKLTKEEMETIISTDDNLKVWHIYTRQKRIIRLLKKINIRADREQFDDDGVLYGGYYTVPFDCIKILNPNRKRRVLSKEHIEKMLDAKNK